MSVAETIRRRLAALEPQVLDLVDERAAPRPCRSRKAAAHWRLSIVSQRFSGHSTLERHRDLRRARRPHAGPHPRARHHGAQPGRNERSNEKLDVRRRPAGRPGAGAAAAADQGRTRQEGNREEGCGQSQARRGHHRRQGERRRGARALRTSSCRRAARHADNEQTRWCATSHQCSTRRRETGVGKKPRSGAGRNGAPGGG